MHFMQYKINEKKDEKTGRLLNNKTDIIPIEQSLCTKSIQWVSEQTELRPLSCLFF